MLQRTFARQTIEYVCAAPPPGIVTAKLLPVDTASKQWWHGATIYQIYPRSFLDTNGDGVGDLPGILERLGHVASLGVDAIWISPFFRSPMADYGYDISDYRDVDPLFGTLADFDRVLARSHELGLRVMIDQVLSHTSNEHPWFQESRESRENPRADWYVWADPREDGTPPNNWLSIFGGVAWQWEPRRGQYYLHNFLAEQPDLNFHQPAVRAAVLENVRFWLERGVDGLRLDAINFCFHDRELRDNPPKPRERRNGRGVRADNPYAYQVHLHDNTRPENIEFLGEVRALLDRYPGTVALGEISSEDSNATIAEYTQPGRLHMAYSFELLGDNGTPAHIRETIENLFSAAPSGWPCWAVSNHDVERVVTRWGHGSAPAHYGTLVTALLCSLRGAVCIYQGEELGLPEAEVPFESLRDPYGIAFWPTFRGRDGCRTPMPWATRDGAGFSAARAWLPIPPQHLAMSVERQEADAASPLHGLRTFLAWRNGQPALRLGAMAVLAAGETHIAVERRQGRQHLVAAFNLGATPARFADERLGGLVALEGHGLPEGRLLGSTLALPPFSAWFGRSG
jgi:alpha-glucosidase